MNDWLARRLCAGNLNKLNRATGLWKLSGSSILCAVCLRVLGLAPGGVAGAAAAVASEPADEVHRELSASPHDSAWLSLLINVGLVPVEGKGGLAMASVTHTVPAAMRRVCRRFERWRSAPIRLTMR